MDEFDFDYHYPTWAYPESGERLQLGGSYMFSAEPTSPDARIITLYFDGMRNYYNETLGAPDLTTDPKLNFGRLDAFYRAHRLWKSFEYRLPTVGLLVCKFNKPLQTPKPIPGGRGLLEGFSVELLEIP